MKLLAYLLIFLAFPLWAHDAWIEPDETGLIVRYGHKTTELYPPEKLKEVIAYDEVGEVLKHDLKNTPQGVRIYTENKPTLLTLEFDNGYWTKTPEGKWVNQPKNQVKGGKEASHPIKFGKTALTWRGGQWFKPVGQRLEIVVQPFSHGFMPTVLPVQVLYEGKPLANATVTHVETDATAKTDGNGLAQIKLTPSDKQPVKGKQRLSVEHKIPLIKDEKADSLGLEANLFFIVD